MSPTSHVVTIPTFSFHHHHHPPPPPRAAATAAIEHPGDCPRVGQPGAGSSMPRHPDDVPDDVPNDATSRHRPSSATTATSLPNGNSRRWGRWGRTDGGENARGGGKERRRASRRCPPDLLSTPGGMEGEGQRRGTSLSPRVLDDDKGAHMCPFVPTCGVVDGGRCESHTPPPV